MNGMSLAIVSLGVFATLLAALAQLPVIGQIVVPVLVVQAGATLVHAMAQRRRAHVVKLTR